MDSFNNHSVSTTPTGKPDEANRCAPDVPDGEVEHPVTTTMQISPAASILARLIFNAVERRMIFTHLLKDVPNGKFEDGALLLRATIQIQPPRRP